MSQEMFVIIQEFDGSGDYVKPYKLYKDKSSAIKAAFELAKEFKVDCEEEMSYCVEYEIIQQDLKNRTIISVSGKEDVGKYRLYLHICPITFA